MTSLFRLSKQPRDERAEPRFLPDHIGDEWLGLTGFWLSHRGTDPDLLVSAVNAAVLAGGGSWDIDDFGGDERHKLSLFGLTVTGRNSRAVAADWMSKASAQIAHYATKRATA